MTVCLLCIWMQTAQELAKKSEMWNLDCRTLKWCCFYRPWPLFAVAIVRGWCFTSVPWVIQSVGWIDEKTRTFFSITDTRSGRSKAAVVSLSLICLLLLVGLLVLVSICKCVFDRSFHCPAGWARGWVESVHVSQSPCIIRQQWAQRNHLCEAERKVTTGEYVQWKSPLTSKRSG